MWQRLAKFLVVLVIGLTAVFSFVWNGTSPASAAACSTSSATPVTLTFVNSSSNPVDIFWIDFACGEVQYVNDLAVGASITQSTFSGHPWIVRNGTSGDPLVCVVATASATITAGDGGYVNGCLGSDGRLNLNQCDDQVVVYQGRDEEGNATLDVFGLDTIIDVNNQQQIIGSLLFTIAQDDIAEFVDNLPEQNTSLESAEGVSAYILTSGEVQINTAPDTEGKVCVLIFNALQPSNMSHYTFDVSNPTGATVNENANDNTSGSSTSSGNSNTTP